MGSLMGRVLPFQSRESYEKERIEAFVRWQQSVSQASKEELEALQTFKQYYDHTLKGLDLLAGFYKKSGKWNEETDSLMARMVQCAIGICSEISGVNNYGTAKGQQEQIEHTTDDPIAAG